MRERARRRQSGQAIIVLALGSIALFGIGAIAIDQGIGMADRRDLQATVDDAALAGSRSLGAGANQANYVAMQYLAKYTGQSMPSPCTSATSCPAQVYTMGNYTFTIADGSNYVDVGGTHSNRSLLAGVLGFSTHVSGTGGRAIQPGPALTGSAYAVATVGGEFHINGGGVTRDPTGNVAGPVYTQTSWDSNNSQHAPGITGTVTGIGGTGAAQGGGVNDCSTPPVTDHVDHPSGGGASDNWVSTDSGTATTQTVSATPGTAFASQAPTTTGGSWSSYASPRTSTSSPDYTGSDGKVHWRPGTYSGIYPSNGVMDGGVFVIKNVAGPISLGAVYNTGWGHGVEDSTGAVAIVLDSSDTGDIDLNGATLDGLDDLHPASYTGTRDPMGTHNFVIWGATYTGKIKAFDPQTTADLSGIIYLPNSTMTDHGRSSPHFAGAVYVSSITIDGGGNGIQAFQWVCGLSSVVANGGGSGLSR